MKKNKNRRRLFSAVKGAKYEYDSFLFLKNKKGRIYLKERTFRNQNQ